jgi:protein-disulfide isomerase
MIHGIITEMFRTFLMLSAGALACLVPAAGATPEKSALDKSTLEAYVRHLFVLGPQVSVTVSDPKPAPLPDLVQVDVRASAGQARQDYVLYVSKDGRKVVQGTIYDIAQNPFKPDLDKLKTDLQPSFGTPGAPVVIVEFSDFQCAYCRQEAQLLRQNLLSAYPRQVRVYYVDRPLQQVHPWARAAALAGRCIYKQNSNAFWDYHDWIFEHQAEITADHLAGKVQEFAKGKEIDAVQLGRCIETKATEPEVAQEIALADTLRVESTPTLFINGRRRVGSQDWPTLRAIIDYEIEYQKTAHNAGEDCGCEIKLPVPGANQ